MQSSPPAAVAADSALLYISGEVVVGYCHWMVTGWLPKANLMHTQRRVQHRRPRPDRRRGPCRWPRERLASEEDQGGGQYYHWRRRKLMMGGLDGHTGADSAIRGGASSSSLQFARRNSPSQKPNSKIGLRSRMRKCCPLTTTFAESTKDPV